MEVCSRVQESMFVQTKLVDASNEHGMMYGINMAFWNVMDAEVNMYSNQGLHTYFCSVIIELIHYFIFCDRGIFFLGQVISFIILFSYSPSLSLFFSTSYVNKNI